MGGVQSFGKIRYLKSIKDSFTLSPPLSIFSPDFPETLDANDKTGFEMLGEGEEGVMIC